MKKKETSKRLDKKKMIKLLKSLDKGLDKPLEIVISGASALILQGMGNRTSLDVDIIKSSEQIKGTRLEELINEIGLKNGVSSDWMNDKAKITFNYLPEDYHLNTKELKEGFDKLQPFIISKADSVITKLAFIENIRTWDIKDIRQMDLNSEDVESIYEKVQTIGKNDPERAQRIEIAFKNIRPELIVNKDGFSYTNIEEIEDYAYTKYSIIIKEDLKSRFFEKNSIPDFPYK